jgi:hypothetical protein
VSARRPASLSLDLDNKWSYLKTHGDKSWESLPSYLPLVVPRFLEMLKERGLGITVFIVGQDAAHERNREALGPIAAAGHEIGNHSFHHEPWLHLYREDQLEAELARAEEAIEAATGRRPHGFRGPGFSLSETTLRVLKRRGYLYDASTLPTYLGPLARAYYFLTSRFDAAEREKRKALFGNLRDGLRPIKPYLWSLGEERLLEVPVTTMPLFKVPIHVSYVLYLAVFSRPLALAYFRTAMETCLVAGVQPSLLLHPLDFLGGDEEPDLSFFPAMGMPGGRKREVVAECLDTYARLFDVMSMEKHARALLATGGLPGRPPVFSHPAAPAAA